MHASSPIRTGDFSGPLAGLADGLRAAHTEFVLTAPCDAPFVDPRLGLTLMQALRAANTDIAYAATHEADGTRTAHPVFALLWTSLADDLEAWLAAGERKPQGGGSTISRRSCVLQYQLIYTSWPRWSAASYSTRRSHDKPLTHSGANLTRACRTLARITSATHSRS